MELKQYQEAAVQKMFKDSTDLLAMGGGKKVVFKAPTGAGKTIMMAAFLELMATQSAFADSISVIWAAPRKLHTQSLDKLKQYFAESRVFNCTEFSGLTDKSISKNEILFMNWESINKVEKNTIVKENEKEFYLQKVVENTKENGNVIILVIDESHHHATSEISKNLIADMQPDLTIEVSATPVLSDFDAFVPVPLEKVKDEGMVKLGVTLNPDFENTLDKQKIQSSLSSGSDIFVLDQGLAKLRELKEAYRSEGSNVNPLLLIQLPDKKSDFGETLQDDLMDHLEEKWGISTAKDNLAIYLSESKSHLENISKPDSPVEVMFFKQAIALGWDCPRASILVLFRDHKSLSFSVQTVGRIMRMPEPEKGHYENPILNHAYVYTNLADISINEDVSAGYLTIFSSKRRADIEPLKLESVYRKRQREKTRLSSDFTRIFLEVANETGLASKLDVAGAKVSTDFISSVEVSSTDQLANQNIHGLLEVDIENEQDLQRLLDVFVVRNLQPFFPERRSIGRVKEAIYKFFKNELHLSYQLDQMGVFKGILGGNNPVVIANVIDEAKIRYLEAVQGREEQLQVQIDWDLPESINSPSSFVEKRVSKSALTPFYSDEKWKSESAFIDFLEGAPKVHWWFKNGERDATYFAVPYEEAGKTKPFYVDFIVKLNDGSLALFDTKSGQTIETARSKSDGLQAYLSEHKGLFGGIATNTSSDYSGRWVYFIRLSDQLNVGDFSNWETLEL